MSEEWFDVVDEGDRVISRVLRHEVHARGLWHRAIHVLVRDRAGRIFLQKRSMSKDLSPGLWDSSCSGHLDSGEDYDAAATRELGEELGIAPEFASARQRWLRLEPSAETGWEFVWVYRLEYEGPFALHPEEIETGAWFTPEEVTARVAAGPAEFCPSFKLIWRIVNSRAESKFG